MKSKMAGAARIIATTVTIATIITGLQFNVALAVEKKTNAALEVPVAESDKIRNAYMAAPHASATAKPAAASPALTKAWKSYYATLDEMRALLEKSSMFLTPKNRAKAFHAMMEVQAIAYNMAVAPRMATPRISTNAGWHDDFYSMGLVGPDWYYGHMYLDGAHTYRLSGRLGENKLTLIQVTSKPLGMEGGKTIGNYDLANMIVAADGSYEIIIGGPKREGNWIALDETSNCNFVFIRRLLTKYGNEDVGSNKIERLTPVGPEYYEREEFDEAAMAERIHRAEMTMRVYIKEFTIGIYDFAMAGTKNQVNTMAMAPGLTYQGASPVSRYAQGVFSIKDDEALIVELDRAPDSVYWGFMLGDIWSRCLPFSRYQTSLNHAQAKRDADGHYRFVVSVRDPGVANWLDTTGHNDGEVFFRNYLTRDPVVPMVRKVKLSDLMADLPADTEMVTPEQRQVAVQYRRDGFVKLYRE